MLAHASSAIFAFSAASIFRLVLCFIVRSVYQTERPFSNLTPGPKNGVHFSPTTSNLSAVATDSSTCCLPEPKGNSGVGAERDNLTDIVSSAKFEVKGNDHEGHGHTSGLIE